MTELQDGRVTGWQSYRMAGVMGMVGAYYTGVRMWPQLMGCALAQEPKVSLFLD